MKSFLVELRWRDALDVLLVAAKRDRIDDRTNVIAQTGRKPVVIDIEAFALSNAYQMNYPERSDPFSALIHIGRSVMIVCLLERGEPIFTRDISIGGQLHLDALMRELGSVGVDEMTAKRILSGQFPNDVSPEQVSAVLREASSHLVLEVRPEDLDEVHAMLRQTVEVSATSSWSAHRPWR